MKIKHHQQHYLNNSNNNNNSGGLSYSSINRTTSLINTMTSSSNNFLLTSNMTDLQATNNNTNNSFPSTTASASVSNSSAIWTRSAAFKAAQQDSHLSNENNALSHSLNNTNSNNTNNYKRNNNLHNSSHSHHHHHHHHLHHGQYQHALGKIVKPIPVRPMSSSSSSSSTHSSLYNSSNLTGAVLLANKSTLPSFNQQTTATHFANTATADTSLNLNTTDLEIDSSASNINSNFSLIAKYFASFPATRLKSTSSTSNSNVVTSNGNLDSTHVCPHHMHHHPHHHIHTQSPLLIKPSDSLFMSSTNQETPTPTQLSSNKKSLATTFMPFKKIGHHQQAKSQTNKATSPANNFFNSNDISNNNDLKIQSTFILRSQSAHQTHKSSNLITNTDHLCTNFKRMIKLSDSIQNNNNFETDPASPLTAASNTPTFDSNDSNTTPLANTTVLDANSTFTFPNFEHNANFVLPTDSFLGLPSAVPNGNNEARFGQITMETRSTRKFLIKHHPYLQLNSNINNNSINTNKLFNQQRPSINLIKMKKLISKSSNKSADGRLSRTNDHLEDSKLLKFTDTAPQIANQLTQSNYSLRVKQNNASSSFKANTGKANKTKKSTNNKSLTEQTVTASAKLTEDWCCCINSGVETFLESHECDHCFDEYDDGQEEDSSGYYSSYHSVDLISSSGGGSIIGDKKQEVKTSSNDLNKPASSQVQQIQQPQIQSQQQHQQQQQQTPVPQHHYHTRYLSNFLQQTNSSSSATNRTTTTTPLNNSKTSISTINNNNNNTTPTTRLRYQQQLAAAAAAASTNNPDSSPTNNMKSLYYNAQHQQHALNSSRFHEQYQLECDLDLDQIEND